ncbi:hypothetical protein GV819_30610 [Pseudomonas sp. Fl5BN2]|uniref:hypothetical protein n=1 Tax=Pseudomonas sp. Fl5BN2 TaxID=2697652 RepID=UPI001378B26A|nr:hypothetical protein [Pseudomonas sp. Fl5BN2]NBF06627.1 hypothetical protein [Pseudomonas sp. Fl5BN2]
MFSFQTSKRMPSPCLFVLGLILVALLTQNSYASNQGTNAFSNLFPLLAQISDQNHPVNQPLETEINKIATIFSAIAKELDGMGKPVPAPFLSSIDAYREQLLRSLNFTSANETTALLKEVSEDAEIKRRYLVATSGFSAFDRPMLVVVSVLTFRGEKSEPGYTVTCNSFRDVMAKGDARFPFSSDTNNASLPLPPGRYRLQIYKGQTLVHSRDIRVGLSSNTSEEVKIDVSNF